MQPPREIANRRYRLLDRLGVGSVAVVYRATDSNLGLERAVKLLPPALGTFFRQIERFRREALAAAQLHHPHVIDVFDVGVEGGWAYIVTEVAHGGPLDAWMIEHGPASEAQAVQWLEETLRALQAAHEHGVIHRDIRPNNILLDKHGHAKVGDFGLARLSAAETAITQHGEAMGQPPWAAPEQLRDARTADGRADVYSAGMTLAWLLTGTEPEHPETLFPRLPAHIRAVVERATAEDPAERWPSAEAMREALLRST